MHPYKKTDHPLEIGVTGGIGSGKSIICKIFSSFYIPVYDADSRAKRIMTNERALTKQIQKELGIATLDSTGRLNKKAFTSLFGEKNQLKKLNQLVHPWVLFDYKKWKNQQKTPYIIKEAALLIETGSSKPLDKLIVVTAPLSLRIQRVLLRDNRRNEQEIHNIIAHQATEEERIKHADYTVINNGVQPVFPQIHKLHRLFINMQS